MFSCHVWFLLSGLIGCTGNSTAAIWFSVPENHHVCLPCGSSGSSDVIWTRQDQEVLVTRRGGYKTNKDCRRYRLMVNGDLCVQHLKESDHGRYRCNQQLVAELQVLTGRDYTVSAGRTLLLPCSGSSKPKQRWFQQREGERREAVLTKYRNGTVKPERGGGRLSFTNDALQIQDLQPEDAGEYVCNGLLQARVTVLAAHAETSSQPPSTSTPPSPAVVTAEVGEIKKKSNMRPENVLLLVAVVSVGLMIIFLAAVCVLLTSMKCRRRKRRAAAAPTREDTELQPWTASSAPTEGEDLETPPLCGETIHYASLGRQNWRERPSRSPPEQSHHSVIYSSVVSRPAARAEHKL
ncbi:inactive tyrosine-protein kinase 7 isoform X1 [Astatotilapia calliptera]|uniref:inactive tyrosine-protein kinase 7 isoform X1 n=1 Tax=Astatotilapia calliptera TaxID=8154 RepID=UPI000E42A6AD|nr:inactive tyrosine-protein kinase 7-like isoform X1 [Astatotilapia calliptera]